MTYETTRPRVWVGDVSLVASGTKTDNAPIPKPPVHRPMTS